LDFAVPRYRLPVTQKRLSNFVFSAAAVAVAGFWLWYLFAHADQIFRSIHYLSRGSDGAKHDRAHRRRPFYT
jgi:hypothetical protein